VVLVETLPATYVSHTSETLHGQVVPFGYPTAAWFEWGLTTNYGNVTAEEDLGSGSSAMPVSAIISGLEFETYHYRVVATNALGVHVGDDNSFAVSSECPAVVTRPATGLTATAATLQGEVNPRWAETVVWFEYGLTTRYGAVTPVTNVGDGPDAVPVGIAVPGLLPWMTHYRVVASNSVGLVMGADQTLAGWQAGAPTLSGLTDQTLSQGGSATVWFNVSDPDTPPENLHLQVSCNNPVLMPGGSLVLGGSGSSRSLTVAPATNYSGSAAVTVTVNDSSTTVSDTFLLTVLPVPGTSPLYLTDARMVSAEAWQFRLMGAGGASNCVVEYRSVFSPTNGWIPATNVTDLGGGRFEVEVGPSQPDLGFYRVKGLWLLTASLGSTNLTVDEGAGVTGPVIVFNRPYVGPVAYTWISTGGINSGIVYVNGTTAVIPIPLADNTDINQLQSLTLRLEVGAGYALLGTPQSSVTVEENDAEWQGVLQTGNASLGFVLNIQRTNHGLQGRILSDGFGFFATNTLAHLTFTENAFCAVATNVAAPLSSASPLLGATHHVDLRLDAANGQPNQSVGATKIEGVATLVTGVAGRPYLGAAVQGTFVLQKPPTPPSTNQVPLESVP
jgi:hypothetical protein